MHYLRTDQNTYNFNLYKFVCYVLMVPYRRLNGNFIVCDKHVYGLVEYLGRISDDMIKYPQYMQFIEHNIVRSN